ncbi:hypothetical protein QTP70_031707, partial [Hemibagrus guttatus]
MLQTISPDLLPFITTVINGSLTSGHVPTAFKKARVIPILKKAALDPSDISNYRPNNLHDPNQSGFKAAHSTETALLAVTEKLHAARSAKLSSVLILLDLSAAFDTVNHKTLLSTLRSLGICGTAWEWFASYLDGCSYQKAYAGSCLFPEIMWINKPFVRTVLIWTALSLIFHPLTAVIQYSAAELLQLRFPQSELPPALQAHLDIVRHPRRKYIHCGSRRSFHYDDSKAIKSFWSSTRHPSGNTGRKVNHCVLASLARSANDTVKHDNANINFGLFNIRSLTNKGHLVQDLLMDRKLEFLCLTETWQQPNDFSQLNESTPAGFVYICQPRASGRGGGLAIIYRERWKVSSVSVPVFPSFEAI